jgi:hypothetical protein
MSNKFKILVASNIIVLLLLLLLLLLLKCNAFSIASNKNFTRRGFDHTTICSEVQEVIVLLPCNFIRHSLGRGPELVITNHAIIRRQR